MMYSCSYLTTTWVVESMACANAINHWRRMKQLKKVPLDPSPDCQLSYHNHHLCHMTSLPPPTTHHPDTAIPLSSSPLLTATVPHPFNTSTPRENNPDPTYISDNLSSSLGTSFSYLDSCATTSDTSFTPASPPCSQEDANNLLTSVTSILVFQAVVPTYLPTACCPVSFFPLLASFPYPWLVALLFHSPSLNLVHTVLVDVSSDMRINQSDTGSRNDVLVS